MTLRAILAGTGSALPVRRVTNAELAEQVDTSDEWIVERTGIRSRYIAGEGETTATLAADAARKALADAGMDASEIGLIVLATATPDQTFPSSATKVQAMLGIDDCVAFDVAAVCSGFLYALSVAESMIRGGSAKAALVIGSETFSRILDWEDRATCVLFGDGAGAIVLKAEDGPENPAEARGVLSTKLHADGRHNELLYVDGGPSTTQTVGKVRMKGREVFRHGSGEPHVGRHRLADPAPGQCPHPRCDREEAEPLARSGGGDGRSARQHLGRVRPAGARRRQEGWPREARRSAGAGGDGRWFHLGRCGRPTLICDTLPQRSRRGGQPVL